MYLTFKAVGPGTQQIDSGFEEPPYPPPWGEGALPLEGRGVTHHRHGGPEWGCAPTQLK